MATQTPARNSVRRAPKLRLGKRTKLAQLASQGKAGSTVVAIPSRQICNYV